MKRKLALVTTTVLAIGLITFARAQTTAPADAERLAKTARAFRMTPEQLDRFIRRELGDPVVIDDDLIVGVRRDDAGRVTSVQITSPAREVRFNRNPDAQNPGLRYSRADADLTDTPNVAAADDMDGDGTIDRIMLTPRGERLPHILLRIGTDFVQAKAVGDGAFRSTDGRTFRFDAAQHDWVAAK